MAMKYFKVVNVSGKKKKVKPPGLLYCRGSSAVKWCCLQALGVLLDVPWKRWTGEREEEGTGKVNFVSSVIYCLCKPWP